MLCVCFDQGSIILAVNKKILDCMYIASIKFRSFNFCSQF